MTDPFLCRWLGHSFVTRPTLRINETRWMQPTSVPLLTVCRRCGTSPGPRPEPTERAEAIENPYCMRCGKHLGKPHHETNEHDKTAAPPVSAPIQRERNPYR